MKKLVLLLVIITLSLSGFSKWLIAIHRDGRVNDDGSVTYDRVVYRDYGFLTYIRCVNKGPNSCPRVGVITVGGIAAQEIINYAEKVIAEKLKRGETSGRMIIKDKVLVIWKDAKFRENGQLEYSIAITDEFDVKTGLPQTTIPKAFYL